jgi:hypothetical protein
MAANADANTGGGGQPPGDPNAPRPNNGGPVVTITPDPTNNPILTIGPNSTDSEVQIVSSPYDSNITVLPPIARVGYRLSIFVLCIITAFLVALVLLLYLKTFDASENIRISSAAVSDSAFLQQKDIIRALQEEKKNYRDFIIQISQMVLLNLLLPTLTAILGYIFGSREGAIQKRSEGAQPDNAGS